MSAPRRKDANPKGDGRDAALLLAPERMARVRQIQVRTRGAVQGALQGAYRSRFRGAGLEFEEVRPYQPGDEVRTIDWNVTARTGAPHVKSYVEDRQLVLQLVVDTSPSMDFGTTERSKREVAAELAALLAFVAIGQQDQVGLTLFADEPGLHLTPDTGQAHVLRVVREVVSARSAGGGNALASVLEHQLRHLKRRAMVFVVSDFLDAEAASWEDELARLGRAHDVLCLRVFDPFEESLPRAGLLTVEDLEGGGVVELDTSSPRVRAAWEERAARRRALVEERARKARVDLVHVRTDADPADALIAAFARRARMRVGGGG